MQGRFLCQGLTQVQPLGICGGDQTILFLPVPALQLFFTGNGRADVFGVLVIYQLVKAIFFRKGIHQAVLVFVESAQ